MEVRLPCHDLDPGRWLPAGKQTLSHCVYGAGEGILLVEGTAIHVLPDSHSVSGVLLKHMLFT